MQCCEVRGVLVGFMVHLYLGGVSGIYLQTSCMFLTITKILNMYQLQKTKLFQQYRLSVPSSFLPTASGLEIGSKSANISYQDAGEFFEISLGPLVFSGKAGALKFKRSAVN